MGITNSTGKTQAVEKDDKGLVLEGSSYQKKAFVEKNSGSSNSITQEENIHSVILPKLPHSGSSDFKAVDKNVTNSQGPYLDDEDFIKKRKKLKKKKNSGSSNSVLQEKPKHYNILKPLPLPPLPLGSCDFKDDGVYSKHKTKSTKKESGVSNSVLQKKNEHPDILPELLHSGSSDFKTSDKTETNEPVPFSDEGVYFKNENKFTKKKSGVSDSVLQRKNKQSDTLPTLSQSGSFDFIAGDENDTNNPGSFLNDGGYYTKKESGSSNSILQETSKHSDHGENETNNPELEDKLSDISSASSYSGVFDSSFEDENEKKNNKFNEQVECGNSNNSWDAEKDSVSKIFRCLSDSSEFKRPDQIKKRSIKYVKDIEDDHENLKTLFSNAKKGKWENVWGILQKKPYMINCCPENRRYTLLHRAAFLNHPRAVSYLLSFPTIDSNGKIKRNPFKSSEDDGLTAFKLVEYNLLFTEVTSMLSSFVCNIDEQAVDTYHSSDEEPAIIRLTLAAYKKTFHPETIEPNKPLYDVLKEVFKLMNTTEVWQEAKYQICVSIRYNKDGGKIIRLIDSCKTQHAFFKAVINLYTREDFDLYAGVNMALRRQRSDDFKPTSEDLAFGPYILVLQTLLWFWDVLEYESSITYRKMLLSENDLDKYQKGISFTWLSFVSSSVNRQMAISFPSRYPEKQKNTNTKSVLFIFDNTNAGQCQPKNVQKFAHVVEEEERVYAAGSRFCVTSREDFIDEDTEIYLQVISN